MSDFGHPLRPAEASIRQSVTTAYLAKLRRQGLLKEAIHYRWLAPGKYRYLSDAIDHFFAHRSEPDVHDKWVEQQLSELNQRQL